MKNPTAARDPYLVQVTMELSLKLSCPEGAANCLLKLREVLDHLERPREGWPSVDQWEQLLPTWFVAACAKPTSSEETNAWLLRWRQMPETERLQAEDTQPWSLADWLHWMEPDHLVWRWARATQHGPAVLEVVLAVEEMPVALGAFTWLARTAGAENVT